MNPGTSEPTLYNVMDVLTRMDERFDGVDMRLDSLNVRIDGLDERLSGVEHRLGRVEVAVLDLQEEFKATQAAVDDNSVQLIDHEERISYLEDPT